ncbi:serine protease HTRA2, mitochondrial-like isoform X2 [Ostrea edulis]|uniref:serine protease HTRA2, mitochondrial-like isoform X2 n=1 Tax=Ostrea edulis TaxID=37623 RepID=UPI0024AEA5EE|nr:serine protease HTRA2, mitochondrial-like isoform X2 [Ostrea edulis]
MVMMTNLYRNTFILRRCILRRKFPNNFERVYRTFNKSFHNETDWTKRTKPGLFNLSCKFSVSLLSVCVFYNLYRKTKNEDVVDYGHGLKIALENAFVVKAASPSVGKRSQFNFIADIVEQTQPAVVFIEVVRGRGFGQTSSSGSGFIVRPDGLILTNAHVVAGASRVQVYLSNGQKVQGTVQAVDQVCDLATVKVNERNLQTLTLGKSSEVRPGEWVVALGSPFNLQKTVTAGIVSNAGRETMGNLTKSPPMIQHDAVINVGNSGGPLINLDGEAIGINTMTLTSGISFALPADLAADFLNRAKRESLNLCLAKKSTDTVYTSYIPAILMILPQ